MRITVVYMQTALTLLGVMTAPAQLVTLEMGIFVMILMNALIQRIFPAILTQTAAIFLVVSRVNV
jgi:hypothetical protein